MFKEYVQNIIKDSMTETNANVAMSMIYGDTTNLDENIKQDFESVGVSHLMSVSGTHITSFMIIINSVLGIKKQRNNNNKIKSIIQLISICIYMIFTGFSISVLRAGIMLIISIICNIFNKKKNKYMLIIITLLVILLHTPYAIFNTGMRLSFLATFGIIMFGKYITQMINKAIQRVTYRRKNKIVKKIISLLTENISITISVQLLIIPIQIQAFNKLPFPVIVPNLILGLLSAPIRIMGTVGILSSFVPSISFKFFQITQIFIKILLYFSNVFKTISYNISTVSMPFIFFVIYYIFILGLYIYFKVNELQNKEESYNLKQLLKYLKIFLVVLLIIITVIPISLNIYEIYFSKYVYFFNVEQGDMSYIKYGKTSMIVDIGSMRDNLAFNTITNYFKTSNLNRVDAIVISHLHTDHINGLEKFLEKYNVGMVIYTKPKTIEKTYINFKNVLKKYNVNSKEVKQSDEVNIGDITIKVLLPGNEYINSSDEVNANSLVCKVIVNNKQLLYMGDASKETEEKLLEQNLDISNIYILKIGHHGSKTATSNSFIQKTKPKHAIISALKKYYGHPHESTLETLKQNNVYTYLTEKQGAIKFSLK